MNMIEKVARAICKQTFGNEEVHGEYRCCLVGGTEGCCAKDLEREAKAAIEAMREPSEGMLSAVANTDTEIEHDDNYGFYQAMIDAALEKGEYANET